MQDEADDGDVEADAEPMENEPLGVDATASANPMEDERQHTSWSLGRPPPPQPQSTLDSRKCQLHKKHFPSRRYWTSKIRIDHMDCLAPSSWSRETSNSNQR
jgi:hypothetical protein